ncbi:MAG: metal ABC transporter permease [Candidatus Sumerlaeia bacterium]|nr:metal ABC transporter permease [Candidatus Sumerlaeia bacterium]
MSDALPVILVGYLAAGACSLLGCFLVLRRMGMMGDAISHAVLPGIVVAFLLSGERAALPMLLGAGSVGFAAAVGIELLHRRGRIAQDASIGIVFTALFALGVLLVARFAGQVDLDMDCVLHGEIAFAALDPLVAGGRELGPRAAWILGAAFLANLAFVLLFWKELKLSTFDPTLAAVAGVGAAAVHYALLGLTSLTAVAAFESVGAVLVVAMLIVPASAAYLMTERLGTMLLLAQAVSLASAVAGYFLAVRWNVSIAGMMVVVSGAIFAVAFALNPRMRRPRAAAAPA